MLHTLLFVLKIAGIILTAILGILILLLCIVLFAPVCYEAAGKLEESIQSVKGRLAVTWFLRLVRLDIHYKEQCLKWRIRIAWFKKTGVQKTEGEKKGKQKEDDGHEETGSEESEYEKNEEISQEGGEDEERTEKNAESAEDSEELQKSQESREPEEPEKARESRDSEEPDECKEKGEESVDEANGIFAKIKKILRKIKEAFQNICDRIKNLRERKDKLSDFLRDEAHVKAFRKGKKEVFKLLKRLNPGKVSGEVRFGFEDPSITGRVLAGLGILYPFLGEHVAVTPDFERRVLKGRIEIKGKVFGYYFLVICWNLFFSRHIRQTYRDIKNFEF